MAKCKGKTTKGQPCGRQVNGKGYCSAHMSQKRGQPPAITEEQIEEAIELVRGGQAVTLPKLAVLLGVNYNTLRSAVGRSRRGETAYYASFASDFEEAALIGKKSIVNECVEGLIDIIQIIRQNPEKGDVKPLLDIIKSIDPSFTQPQKIEATVQQKTTKEQIESDPALRRQLREYLADTGEE